MGLLLFLLLQDDPAALVERLRSDDPVVRSAALVKLRDAGEAAAPALRAAAGDADVDVAGHVAFLLRRIDVVKRLTPGLRALVPGVDDQLASGDPNAWTRLLFELVTRKVRQPAKVDLEPLAGPALAGARNEAELLWTCQVIEQMRFATAVPELVRVQKDARPAVSEAALSALAVNNAPEAIPVLIRRLREGAPDGRLRAVALLSQMGGRAMSVEVAKLLGASSAPVRLAAVQVLHNSSNGDLEFVHETLLRAVGDADPAVRALVLEALGSSGLPAGLPAIAKATEDPEPKVRIAALDVLGEMDATNQAAVVRRALGDPSAAVREAAVRAAATLVDREAADGVAALLGDPDADVRRAALKALVPLDARSHGEAAARGLADGSADVRLWAAWASGRLGATSAREKLESMLADREAVVRLSAAGALRRLRMQESAPALMKRLADENPIVRGTAARTLGELRAREAAGAVTALLKDRDAFVRASAAFAAGELGGAEVEEALKGLLDDEGELEETLSTVLDGERFTSSPEFEELREPDMGLVRGAAARALVLRGRKEGIGPLIEENITEASGDPTPLNAFREPELTARLRAVSVEAPLPLAPYDRLKEIARLAGLGFEGEDFTGESLLRPCPKGATLWEALLDATSAGIYEAVLSPGKLRVMPDGKSSNDWEAWWEKQPKD